MISVIVATYERHRALDATLRGLSKQSDQHFEVLVADDGSSQRTAEVIGRWRERSKCRVTHIWQPDDGFRLAEIRNRAVAASAGEYLVFLDGDCIPRPNFVAKHRCLAEPGWMVCGHRLMLSESLTKTIIQDGLPIEDWRLSRWFVEFQRGSIDRMTPFLRLPGSAWRRKLIRNRTWKVRGCNMAVWRSDFLKADGFDSQFIGWGHEDYDLAERLQMLGVHLKDGRWATGVFHLWHPLADRSHEAAHWEQISAAKTTKRVLPVRGYSALKS